MTDTVEYAQPLTLLSEDEIIFRDSVRDFADAQVRPLVREMDEHARFSKTLLGQLFDLGVMGIEVPEAYGGAGDLNGNGEAPSEEALAS